MEKYYYKFNTPADPTPSDTQIVVERPDSSYMTFGDGFEAVDWTKKYQAYGELKDIEFPAPPPPYVPSLEELKRNKLQEISGQTRQRIVGGFVANAMGTEGKYDSDEADQQNIMLMYNASRSPDFPTHPVYKGEIPIRAVPTGETEKVILQHNAEQMQKLNDAMALHIGTQKQIAWVLQEQVNNAENAEELNEIKWPE